MKLSTFIIACLFIAGCAGIYTYGSRPNFYKVEGRSAAPPPPPPPLVASIPQMPEDEEKLRQQEEQRRAYFERQVVSAAIMKPEKNASTDEEIDRQLYSSSMIFTIPVSANIDDQIQAEFIIDPSKTLDEIEKIATDTSGQIIKEKINVSRTVTARLIAPNFKKDPTQDIRQVVSKVEPTKWTWVLTPTQEGPQTIQLRVVAHILVDGERVERELQTFKKDLTVVVTSKQKIYNFINEYLEFILGTLVIPFLLWFGAWLRSKFKKKKR